MKEGDIIKCSKCGKDYEIYETGACNGIKHYNDDMCDDCFDAIIDEL